MRAALQDTKDNDVKCSADRITASKPKTIEPQRPRSPHRKEVKREKRKVER
jgi:hypothetical protein